MFTATGFSQQDIVRNGLVLWLDSNDKTSYPGSGNTWTDLSKGGTKGTLTNGPTFNSGNGGAIVFDGANDYVDIPYNSALYPYGSSPRTINAWFKPTRGSYVSPGEEVFSVGGNAGNGGRVAVWVDQSNQGVGIEMVNCVRVFTTWSGFNTWVNICAVVPNGTTTTDQVLVYYNSTQGGIYGGGVFPLNTGNVSNVTIGTISGAFVLNFAGNVAVAQIYNRALSATEVKQNYNALKSRFGL